MDELKRKRFDTAVAVLESEFGMHALFFKDKEERDDAAANIRLGKAMIATLLPEPINELPF